MRTLFKENPRETLAPVAAALFLATLLLAVAVAGCAGREAGGDGGNPAAPVYGVYSPGSLDEVPPSAAAAMLAKLGLESLAEYEDYSVDMIADLGVGWARVGFLFDGWNFHEPGHLDAMRLSGIDVMGTARPVNPFVPEDLSRFQDQLRRLVGRYPWIRTWQIGNEPNLLWDETDYVRLFLAGRQAVLDACPDCRVVLAGVASRAPSPEAALSYYDGLLSLIDAAAPAGVPFQVFDMHYYGYYGDAGDMLGRLQDYRRLLSAHGYGQGVSFWVTETSTTGGVSAPAGEPFQTEQQQADELVRRFATLLGAGCERVAWARPYENYRYHDEDGGYYDFNAIIYNGLGGEAAFGIPAGTPKLAYRAYQTMIGMTGGFSKVEALGPGAFRFRFGDGRSDVYVVWGGGGEHLPRSGGALLVTDPDGERREVAGPAFTAGVSPVFVQVEGGTDRETRR